MRKDDKIFIPLTLDNSTKTALGNMQFLGITGVGVFIILLQVFLLIYYADHSGYSWFAHPLVLILVDILLVYLAILFLRKVIFKENQLLKAYESNRNNEIADLSFIWDIFSIDKDRIYYLNGYVAAIVQFKHGYIYDRPEMHVDIHRHSIQTAIGTLARKGYWIRYYNREVKDSNLEPLYLTKKGIAKESGTNAYNLITDILNHVERVCADIGTIEEETCVIIAPDMHTIQGLDIAVEEMIASTRSGLFTFAQRLNVDQIYEFICSLYGVSSIDSDSLLSKKFSDFKLQVVTELEVIRNSEEESYSNETPVLAIEDDPYVQEYLAQLQALDTSSTNDEGDIYL